MADPVLATHTVSQTASTCTHLLQQDWLLRRCPKPHPPLSLPRPPPWSSTPSDLSEAPAIAPANITCASPRGRAAPASARHTTTASCNVRPGTGASADCQQVQCLLQEHRAGDAAPDVPGTTTVPAATFAAVSPVAGTSTEGPQGRPRLPYGPVRRRLTGEMQGSAREKCAGLYQLRQ